VADLVNVFSICPCKTLGVTTKSGFRDLPTGRPKTTPDVGHSGRDIGRTRGDFRETGCDPWKTGCDLDQSVIDLERSVIDV